VGKVVEQGFEMLDRINGPCSALWCIQSDHSPKDTGHALFPLGIQRILLHFNFSHISDPVSSLKNKTAFKIKKETWGAVPGSLISKDPDRRYDPAYSEYMFSATIRSSASSFTGVPVSYRITSGLTSLRLYRESLILWLYFSTPPFKLTPANRPLLRQ
jgi:hypothetical protein